MATYRVISFDGGGIRGAFTTQVLLRLTQPPYNLDLSKVQLYAGTSTGSVIAGGLAMGLPIEKVARFYEEENCKFIFSRKRFFGLNLFGPKYQRGPLHDFLSEQYSPNPKFSELPHGLALSSFQLQSPLHDWLCVFFNNRQDVENHPRQPEFDYRELRLLDAVLASSAAPTYFPAYAINGRASYIDGGVVANNPGVAGLAVATDPKNLDHAHVDDVRLLSIGNGRPKRALKGTPKWGIAEWMGPSLPLMNILSDGSSDADHYYCLSMLGKRGYRRLQVQLKQDVVLDDYKSVPEMVALAHSTDAAFEEQLNEIATWFNAD